MKNIKIFMLLILSLLFLVGCQKINVEDEIKKVEVSLNVSVNKTKLEDIQKNNLVFSNYDDKKFDLDFSLDKNYDSNKLIVKYQLVFKSNKNKSSMKEKVFYNFYIEDSQRKINEMVDNVMVTVKGNVSEIYLENVDKEDIVFSNYQVETYELEYLIIKNTERNLLTVKYQLKDKIDNDIKSKEVSKEINGFKVKQDISGKDPNFQQGGTINGYTSDKYLFLLDRMDFLNKQNIYPSYNIEEKINYKENNINLVLTLKYLNDEEMKVKYHVKGEYFNENIDDIMEITGFKVLQSSYSVNQKLAIKEQHLLQLIENKVSIEDFKNLSKEDILASLESLRLQDEYNNIIDVFDDLYVKNITNIKIKNNTLKMFFNISRKLYKYENGTKTKISDRFFFNKELDLNYYDKKDALDYILSKITQKEIHGRVASNFVGLHKAKISPAGQLFNLEEKYEKYFPNLVVFIDLLSVNADDSKGELYVVYRTKIVDENTYSNNVKTVTFKNLLKVDKKYLSDNIYLIHGDDYLNKDKLNIVLKDLINSHIQNNAGQDKKYDKEDKLVSRVFPARTFYINPEAGFDKYTEGIKKKVKITINQNEIEEYYDEVTQLFEIDDKKIHLNNILVQFDGVEIEFFQNYYHVKAIFKISIAILSSSVSGDDSTTIIEYENKINLGKYNKLIG